jgi:hypothetical protein
MGYSEVPDDEFEASLVRPDGTAVSSAEWNDPRQGDSFVFVDFLRSQSPEQPCLDQR